ncbi:choline-phosphate cytidylyltransferase [Blastocladiella emersonii ATCC 22665]|nr:choline-phosphate cytidylyltransferase [Blastocladiella emersonii ATCC 22665]
MSTPSSSRPETPLSTADSISAMSAADDTSAMSAADDTSAVSAASASASAAAAAPGTASASASGASTPHIPDAVLQSPSVDVSATTYSINAPPTGRPVRIYCDGIYDLFHYGHARALQQAKQAFPDVYLLVGVCSDRETHARKGKTVMTDVERYASVAHCKWVDEVVEDAPWIVTQEFLDKHQIDYVAHDDIPYAAGDVADVYAFVKQQGRFLPTKRTDGVSTSDMITRIVRDYDKYLRRNLARGVSPRELNIGFFTEKRLAVEKSVQEIKDEIKAEVAEWKDEWRETVRAWEHKSSHYVKGFVQAFKSGVKMLRIRSPSSSAPPSPTAGNGRRRRRRDEFEADDTSSGDNVASSDDDDDQYRRASSSSASAERPRAVSAEPAAKRARVE